jgi:hypothetical protein
VVPFAKKKRKGYSKVTPDGEEADDVADELEGKDKDPDNVEDVGEDAGIEGMLL